MWGVCVFCTIYDVVSTLYDVVYTLYDVVYTLYDVVYTLYDVMCTLYTNSIRETSEVCVSKYAKKEGLGLKKFE